jgi:hypothetical protein
MHDAPRMRAHVQQTNHARPAPLCALAPPTKPCIPRRVRCASLCKHWHGIFKWHTRCSASQEGQGSRSVGVGKSVVPEASTRQGPISQHRPSHILPHGPLTGMGHGPHMGRGSSGWRACGITVGGPLHWRMRCESRCGHCTYRAPSRSCGSRVAPTPRKCMRTADLSQRMHKAISSRPACASVYATAYWSSWPS